MKRIWQTWRHLGARRDVAIIMLIMGLGRLGLYQSRPLADALAPEIYGLLLVSGATALALSYPVRHQLRGRFVAVPCAALLFALAVDATITTCGASVTAGIELWLAYLLVEEALV